MGLNIDEIKSIIPHRYPFLLIDRIEEYEPGKWAKGVKNVTVNEPFFQGHFPEKPVMPGVLIVEALAQVGAVTILTVPDNKGKLVLFGGMDKVKFRRQVVPGDVLTLEVELTRLKGPVGKGEGVCTVNGEKAVSSELTFALQ
ncbi:3-hydroxyacyl-ACP dehydratase FabZ [Natranaerofaba carboxydovora]|uniref:3-hydroxyacyl-ACP dehydratase FabZ n=1 Tax=Natranaerofaba carboxydovora TaxID=2742683 RepID=UPI001F132C3D|nr:3-hydroxyacyl-ACP dehydratase FabZ [Natranaerofaba carboxydovora]UMZ75049.1 3-hydroxyacyl-[acyl-carrier-protein] dehydratase FabZ [Natranaerofaba carboxydovora]